MFKRCKYLLQADNQEGSIMVIALMVLAIMTVIGIMAANMTITENFIIRNAGIHKHNVSLVEGAVMEGLQDIIQTDVDKLDPDATDLDWINNKNESWAKNDWYNSDFASRLLDSDNSVVPEIISNNHTNSISILSQRGEEGNGNLRIAVVGWETMPSGESLKATAGTWNKGRVLAEYVSTDSGGNANGFGMLRMELGFKRKFDL